MAAIGNINNPFRQGQNNVAGIGYTHDPQELRDLSVVPGGPDLQGTLTMLRGEIGRKYDEIRGLGGAGVRITQNLVLIKTRVNTVAALVTNLFDRLQGLETRLQTSFDETLQNIGEDIAAIRQGGMDQIVGEIAAINQALNQLRDGAVAADQQLEVDQPGFAPGAFNTLPQAPGGVVAGAVQNPQPPDGNANVPAGFYGGGKKKKGGYTYPKMRSRSRLRSHPRITHKFNTIKPKKKSRRHRKHKKSAKKHRKH